MTRSRKDCRGGRPCQPQTIAEALCCLVQHSELDVADLATALTARFGVRVSRAFLYELSDPHRPLSRAIAVGAAATVITGRGVLLEVLCRHAGGAYVGLPAITESGQADTQIAAATLREFSEALQAFAEGGADRVWTSDELERLERESHEAIEAILQMVAFARRQAGLPAKAASMVKASLDSGRRPAFLDDVREELA